MNKLTSNEIKEARDWLKDLGFSDIEDFEIDELSDSQIEKAISRLWDGGIECFKSVTIQQ